MPHADEHIIEFLKINQYYMTMQEMIDELNMDGGAVRRICRYHGIIPIKKGERDKEFILSHYKTMTIAEMSEVLRIDYTTVGAYCRDFGIKPKKETSNEYQEENKHNLREEILSIIIKHDPEHAHTFTKMFLHADDKPRTRFKDKYNQTGSSLTDELNGIETTKRDKTLYE